MEGYTTININGQEVGILFGLFAIQRIFEKLNGISVELNESRKNVAIYKHILYSGYLCDCEAMDEKPTLTQRDFHMFIEKCAVDGKLSVVEEAVKVYNRSTEVKDSKEQTEDEKKNQLIGTM